MRFMDHCNGPGGEFDDGRCMNLGDQDRIRWVRKIRWQGMLTVLGDVDGQVPGNADGL